ncbi:RIP metalloprotease RseP [Martelella endophytica]|uniref:Zinc metalloprotease n=1 Tax=Martelella endophytica TaxID=1486262 RepID=A0A0D5LSC4_MAREN|nr:RIP metalloprotease RseP [Martelella endophytica]AJY46677.1 zinc metalloprotease [Martelella endophytica]
MGFTNAPGMLVAFIIAISFLVFFHELGHYLVARWSGIRVLAFSLGFGPELIGRTDRHGTRWKICAVPLGGYVRFYGDEDAASRPDFEGTAALPPEERAKTFNGAALWKRAATVAAGPIANFLLAIAIFAVIFAVYGRTVSDPVVAEVQPGSPAAEAGIEPGDVMKALDGHSVDTFDAVVRYVSVRPGLPIRMTVERDGAPVDLTVTPERVEDSDRFGNTMELGRIGVVATRDSGNFRVVRYGPVDAVWQGVLQSWHIVVSTYDYITNVFAGRMKADQIGGPVRVASMAGQMASLGFVAFANFAAILSVSVGLFNLLPVPMLDGGHLLFYAIEALRGRPLSQRVQEFAFRVGLFLVLALMVFATWNDTIGRMG